MMIQFKSPSEKKTSGSGDIQTKLNTTTLKQCPLQDGDHKIWRCNNFKQKSANEGYETLKKLKLSFCCLNPHMIKVCKSERVCGVNGCTKKHKRMLHLDFGLLENDNKSEDPRSRNRAGSSSILSTGNSGVFKIETHFNRQWQQMCRNYCTLWYWIHRVIYGSKLSFVASPERQKISHVSSRNTWFVRLENWSCYSKCWSKWKRNNWRYFDLLQSSQSECGRQEVWFQNAQTRVWLSLKIAGYRNFNERC